MWMSESHRNVWAGSDPKDHPCLGCHPLDQLPQSPSILALNNPMESCGIDTVYSEFQHSKFCTSLNTTPLKAFIILQILSSHQDLLEISTFLYFFKYYFCFFFFFFLSGFSCSLHWYHLFFPGQGDTPAALPGGVTQLCQQSRAPGTCQDTGDTCPHRAEFWAVTGARCEPAGNVSQASPVSTGANQITELGRFLQHFQAATGDF